MNARRADKWQRGMMFLRAPARRCESPFPCGRETASDRAMAQTSLTQFIRKIDTGAHVSGAGFVGTRAAFALGDGTLVLVGEAEERIAAHPDGAIMVAAADGRRMVTGGDDGRVVEVAADGSVTELGASGGAWVDAVALGPDGAVAWSAGKAVSVRDGKGVVSAFSAPSTVRGLCFAPKGFQVAISRYNGVSLWFPRMAAEPKNLEWKGSHLDVTWSPDGRFVVTSMQENTLHGWRVVDGAHMRMSGYPSKTRSFDWSPDGKWLATAGAEAAIVWPFKDKEGPMGKAPKELGIRPAKVVRVAYHPKTPVLAVGYEDGMIMLVRSDDGAELLARGTGEGGAITALAWDPLGLHLTFGTEEGPAGILTLPKA